MKFSGHCKMFQQTKQECSTNSPQRNGSSKIHCTANYSPKEIRAKEGRREKLEERKESEKETRKHSNIFGWKCSWPLFSPSLSVVPA